ncbi:MAG: hypothetical protein F9K40_21570, partial [Kofleriaceae bacterium]
MIREALIDALVADLIGPFDETGAEVLKLPPSRWYLCGMLAPTGRPPEGGGAVDEDPLDDNLGADDDEDEEETAGAEPEPKQKHRLPSSMGLSVLLPPNGPDEIVVTVRWAEYVPEPPDPDADKRLRPVWRRVLQPEKTERIRLDAETIERGVTVKNAVGVRIAGKLADTAAPGLDDGARALALFVINDRAAGEVGRTDAQFLFQVEMAVTYEGGLLPRPDQRGMAASDWDDRVADVQFRDRKEWAVGHGVLVAPVEADADGVVRTVKTAWIPRATVHAVRTNDQAAPGVETSMEALGALADGDAIRAALRPLVDAYTTWITTQDGRDLGEVERNRTRVELMHKARLACERIARGIEMVATHPRAQEAFRIANQAMARQARQRRPKEDREGAPPRWRLFQLAFLMLNIPGIVEPTTKHQRDTVELIFFPTGGGKTEAYLGVIAFTLALRRLDGQERPDGGLGVAVLLRYTLRLLTLDQLERAATLICAMERIRQARPHELGEVRFAIGLWVGRSATANTLDEVKKTITEWKT